MELVLGLIGGVWGVCYLIVKLYRDPKEAKDLNITFGLFLLVMGTLTFAAFYPIIVQPRSANSDRQICLVEALWPHLMGPTGQK